MTRRAFQLGGPALLFFLALPCAAIGQGCYTSPTTGQQICPPPSSQPVIVGAGTGTGTCPNPPCHGGSFSVDSTAIREILMNDQAKAALEKALPQISEYYDQI